MSTFELFNKVIKMQEEGYRWFPKRKKKGNVSRKKLEMGRKGEKTNPGAFYNLEEM